MKAPTWGPNENLTLTEAELNACRPVRGEGGRAIRAFCPFHGSDRQRSLRVDVESGRFQCFACGAWGYMAEARERRRAERLQGKKTAYNLLFAPLGRELGGFSEWIFEVDPFIIAGELEQPQNIRWDIVRQMALYMVIIGQIDNLNRVEHIQQYTGCWAV